MNGHDLLTTLRRADKPITRLELAQDWKVSKTTVAQAISVLVKSGLVIRTQERDARNRPIYKYSLPDQSDPYQVRTFPSGIVTVRCEFCGKRHRVQHLDLLALVQCRQTGRWREYSAEELDVKKVNNA